jgi:hypothetical protein
MRDWKDMAKISPESEDGWLGEIAWLAAGCEIDGG